jgi:hypothetical protein
MASREEGHRRTRNATVGLAAASLVGTVAIAVTVAVQSAAQATGTTDSTNNGTSPDQGDSGFAPPDGNLSNGNNSNPDLGGTQGGTGSRTLPHARSGGSR